MTFQYPIEVQNGKKTQDIDIPPNVTHVLVDSKIFIFLASVSRPFCLEHTECYDNNDGTFVAFWSGFLDTIWEKLSLKVIRMWCINIKQCRYVYFSLMVFALIFVWCGQIFSLRFSLNRVYTVLSSEQRQLRTI